MMPSVKPYFEKIKQGLQTFAPDKEITISRAMLHKGDVTFHNLPTRESKASDKKKGYEFCCELDAVPPNLLREEVKRCITRHINEAALYTIRSIEAEERESIQQLFSYHTTGV